MFQDMKTCSDRAERRAESGDEVLVLQNVGGWVRGHLGWLPLFGVEDAEGVPLFELVQPAWSKDVSEFRNQTPPPRRRRSDEAAATDKKLLTPQPVARPVRAQPEHLRSPIGTPSNASQATSPSHGPSSPCASSPEQLSSSLLQAPPGLPLPPPGLPLPPPGLPPLTATAPTTPPPTPAVSTHNYNNNNNDNNNNNNDSNTNHTRSDLPRLDSLLRLVHPLPTPAPTEPPSATLPPVLPPVLPPPNSPVLLPAPVQEHWASSGEAMWAALDEEPLHAEAHQQQLQQIQLDGWHPDGNFSAGWEQQTPAADLFAAGFHAAAAAYAAYAVEEAHRHGRVEGFALSQQPQFHEWQQQDWQQELQQQQQHQEDWQQELPQYNEWQQELQVQGHWDSQNWLHAEFQLQLQQQQQQQQQQHQWPEQLPAGPKPEPVRLSLAEAVPATTAAP
ncbi:unnamed protein product, partial [Polarella glacialis]